MYGNQQIDTLSKHYFKDNQDKSERLKAQWHGMKYHIRDVLKPDIRDSVKRGKAKITSTEWLLLQLMKHTVLRRVVSRLDLISDFIFAVHCGGNSIFASVQCMARKGSQHLEGHKDSTSEQAGHSHARKHVA